jgi:hypothetical protein
MQRTKPGFEIALEMHSKMHQSKKKSTKKSDANSFTERELLIEMGQVCVPPTVFHI